MTAQHAPHTTPLWRQILSLPHTPLGWWAVGLVAFAFSFTVANIIVFEVLIEAPWEDAVLETIGLFLILPTFLVGPVGASAGGLALIWSHERSGLVWLALVLGFLPVIPFLIQGVLYATNSPWYSP